MTEEKFEGTTFDSKNSISAEGEVDELIAGALKELEKPKEKETKEESVLKATPMDLPPKTNPPLAKKEEKKPDSKVYDETFKEEFSVGMIVPGVVVKIDPSGALVDVGYKSDGWVDGRELSANIKVGDKIKVMVEKLESKEGYVLLSKKNADFESDWNKAYLAYKNKTVIEAKVISSVKGGLVVDVGGIRGFIPASQVAKNPEVSLDSFVGRKLPVKVIEINRKQSKVVLSHKLGENEKGKLDASKVLDELEVGQVRSGTVSSLKSFGAFVDLGGIEGLIHLSELSWKRVKHPSEVLKVGEKIDVFVLGVDHVNKKVSLGLKELQPDPWESVLSRYKAGQIVKVKVLRIAKFGVFAELEEGLEGLIHLSELSKERVEAADSVVKPGDFVEVKILRIIPEEQKIGLSIKEVQIEKDAAAVKEQNSGEDSKVTIGDMLAEKERQKAEYEANLVDENLPEDKGL
ncbi:hypothetical protein A2526_02835 [candidate division WOR-1 bacterium RIFOXYD2_FULL_36_8]|uniref:S1 motif domain-containing protein n=1 Tax=candidate division WOR-1 bacterium RIFOXYB2_FULL_36_35 TaxID=1802578 RepID=A0A1F4S384_UNCSA|nr:MAG: hypothetical protein A2230_06925 [candidate division WOR-1 bacterium RIFOXYA2_FULL_36_21]OGC14837.1 MAG: hypothetical protein A2290_00900 [candidate division WOR-1 bacterium RIFOXYB2_FULL_36_35]OGC15589.1 MAG: hypothetical protein A2282_09145 [candidate division WOR-1 bacterium RIFOXYA12_FULL_36_13]OGC39150.1 MAG: hypothetical protein A2526_02835 [candidate division WOR-1 bacterium RIFOXYD2_FULL_36_8]